MSSRPYPRVQLSTLSQYRNKPVTVIGKLRASNGAEPPVLESADGVAIKVSTQEPIVNPGETVEIRGCVSGDDTITEEMRIAVGEFDSELLNHLIKFSEQPELQQMFQ
eukprot:NODE_2279_length_607_cov_211.147917_g2229_i0.p1 GENE.NODE_2279_length_607_cov_211.147917_g2229_i0~~NODE_2279_length_607_cov_211.147917_g2229_i0.p1  ORF type:complete len:108 (-),score=16.21 NODE_2279_length_607_cov_211.147917_g2229_i0:166-489(-)